MTAGCVVIAERDPAAAGVLRWVLREQGFSAHIASPVALDEIERLAPDVVLLDVSDADRSDHLSALRARPALRNVRVIVAEACPGGALSRITDGADDRVTKPYRVPDLLVRITRQLLAGRARDGDGPHVALENIREELEQARHDAAVHRQLLDILQQVTGELSSAEIYRMLARRVAHALELANVWIVVGSSAEATISTVASFDDAIAAGTEVSLDRFPEIRAALGSARAVVIEEAAREPMFATVAQGGDRPLVPRSAIALPFGIDDAHRGVLCLRTERHERPLHAGDLEFLELVIGAVIAAIRRATALERTRADNVRLEALATTDSLTLVLNRRALLDRLATEVDRARRFGSPLALLLVDADYFKRVNDTAGHIAGDGVLRQLAAMLADAVRRVDIVARYGGEEFVLILPETSEAGAMVFAERLRDRVSEHAFDLGGGRRHHLTVSIGVATFPSPEVDTTEALFVRADEAVYRAKSGGRNQVCR